MPRRLSLVALSWIASIACLSASAGAQTAEKRVLINGVPFVGYREAAGFSRENPLENPTYLASLAMVMEYWGHPAREDHKKARIDAFGEHDKGNAGWGRLERKEASGLQDLKDLLVKGVPVVVQTTLTPEVHYLYPTLEMILGQYPKKELRPPDRKKLLASGALGIQLCSLEYFDKVATSVTMEFTEIAPDGKKQTRKRPIGNVLHEIVVACHRVVVGYDDARRILTLMDASYGPGWEVPYDEFARMWKPVDNTMTVVLPSDPALARKQADTPYRDRTTDERAAELYHRAYGLVSIGRASEAEPLLLRMHQIPGIGDPYHHLLHLEQAYAAKEPQAAIEALEEAVRLIPDDAAAWSALHQFCVRGKNRQRAAEVKAKLDALEKDKGAIKRFVRSMPTNITFWGLGIGWAGETAR